MQLVRKPARRWLSFWLALSLIFVQIATSAYACVAPLVRASETVMTMEAGQSCDTMAQAGAHQLDAEQPGLCVEHCQYGKKMREPSNGPQVSVPQPALIALFVIEPPIEGHTPASSIERHTPRESIATPPIGLLNCCFRT